ncbi:MAG: SGNH/GDSL hydrolase family protein [Candidatus Saccharimonadales bacterium]
MKTNTLYAGDANCEFEDNITNTWSSYITDETRWGGEVVSMTEDAKLAFVEAMVDGDVSVSQVSWQQTSTRVGKYVTVYFSEDKTSYLDWSGWNNALSVKGYQYGLLIGCNSGIDTLHPTVYLFSTPAFSTTGTLSQNTGSSSPIVTNFFTNATQNLPTGYAGVSIVTQPSGTKYVAMGDSYSSGEGSLNYDLPGGDCHRSSSSYPYYLVNNQPIPLAPLVPLDFVACSGAITDDLFNSNSINTAEDAQMSHLKADTAVVTLTIGGNDIGFTDATNACADYTTHSGYSCATNSSLSSAISSRMSAFEDSTVHVNAPGQNRPIHSLSSVLSAIVTAAPNAKIYIAGYPHLFGASTSNYEYDGDAPGAYKCIVTHGIGPVVAFAYSDAQWLNDKVDELNQIVSDAVDNLANPDVLYVSPSTFDTHGLCDSSSSYLNDIHFTGFNTVKSESLHPNVDGITYGYGVAFEAKIN